MKDLSKCNCGRRAKYFTNIEGQGSCNKYSLCPTYEELGVELEKYKQWYYEVLEAGNDLRTFREGTGFYDAAEAVILKHK